ncbi:MAG: S-layer homology domain-containing protein [Oscillospiraceae bacterium]
MKKIVKRSLALCLCSVLLVGGIGAFPASAAAGEGSGTDFSSKWEYKVDESGVGYYALDVVYCENPVDPALQHMVIYAPAAYMTQGDDGSIAVNPDGRIVSSTGVVYTARTAPILYHNTSGGYSSSSIQPVNLEYLREGYVHVSIQTRGKESTNAAGEFIGQFPALMVDLKAGIRFLKAHDDVLPGNSERIVSRGYSSGGAVSAMLGASGNSPIFERYLKEIGAADAADDIFIALASAPITNLSSADASYEWYQYANETYSLFNAMAFDREGNDISDIFPVGMSNKYTLGSNILGGAHEDELSTLLYDWYVAYVQGLGFDLGDDGRSGAYYEGFAQIYSDALTEFVARYDELKGLLVNQRNPVAPETAEDYLKSLGEGWFTYDKETGKVTINSLDDVIVNHIARKKMCPSLDSYNYKSNENDAFKAADGTTLHFSPVVRDALKTLLDNADQYGWTEDELQYITDLYNDYAAGVTDEAAEMLEIMSPINYVVGKEGYEATIAPYWRLRVGSEDGDHGAPAAWLIAQGLEKYTDADVSVGIAWGMGHSLSELTEQDLYDYIAGIMVKEDQLPVVKSSFDDVSANDWYFDAVEYVNAQGLMGGTGGNRFAPKENTSRAMLMTILARLDGVDTAGGATWYEKGTAWAVENKVSDGTNPEGTITRQEIVTMLWRYAQSKGYDVSVGEDTNILSYDDALAVGEWAIPAMQWACGAGIVQGSGGRLNPGAAASRAEIAVMLMRFCETIK